MIIDVKPAIQIRMILKSVDLHKWMLVGCMMASTYCFSDRNLYAGAPNSYYRKCILEHHTTEKKDQSKKKQGIFFRHPNHCRDTSKTLAGIKISICKNHLQASDHLQASKSQARKLKAFVPNKARDKQHTTQRVHAAADNQHASGRGDRDLRVPAAAWASGHGRAGGRAEATATCVYLRRARPACTYGGLGERTRQRGPCERTRWRRRARPDAWRGQSRRGRGRSKM